MATYSLFEKISNRNYQRISDKAYSKAIAVRVFQSQLIDGAFSGRHVSLRPVKDIKSNDPMNMCSPCSKGLHNQHIKYFNCQCNCLMFRHDERD